MSAWQSESRAFALIEIVLALSQAVPNGTAEPQAHEVGSTDA